MGPWLTKFNCPEGGTLVGSVNVQNGTDHKLASADNELYSIASELLGESHGKLPGMHE